MWSLLTLITLASFTRGAVITGISTIQTQLNEQNKKGSYRGQTDLYIRGAFSTGDPSVYSISIGNKPCSIVHFDTDESNIHCLVPPSSSDTQSTQNITILSSIEDMWLGYQVTNSFSYDYDRTPWILYVNPTEACPGDEIAFVGHWGTSDFTLIDHATVAGHQMTLLDDIEQLDPTVWYNVSYILNDNIHGDVNASIVLKNGYGLSDSLWVGFMFGSSGEAFNFRTLAKIDSISQNEGSSAGGLELTINGAGFPNDLSRFDIKVDGSLCEVKSSSYSRVVCTTSAKNSTSAPKSFPGGSGLLLNEWLSILDFPTLISSVVPNFTSVVATSQIKNNEAFVIKNQLSGLFIAQNSGNHTFFISTDDGAIVYLSTDETPNNKVAIINYTSYTELKDVFRNPSAVSNPIQLTQGNAYYLEIWHTQYSGNSHFELGAKTPGQKINNNQFVQHIYVGPPQLTREVQRLKIGGPGFPTGGKLAIFYGAKAVSPVAWSSGSSCWKCSDIQNALISL